MGSSYRFTALGGHIHFHFDNIMNEFEKLEQRVSELEKRMDRFLRDSRIVGNIVLIALVILFAAVFVF